MLKNFFYRLLDFINKRVEMNPPQYVTFGLFMLANIPFLEYYERPTVGAETGVTITVTVIAIIICLLLTLKNWFSKSSEIYWRLFWYFALLYCLAFYSTYNLLLSYFSLVGMMNMMLYLFLMLLLVDWLSFITLTVVGSVSGVLIYYIFIFNSEYFSVNQFQGGINFATKHPYVIVGYVWVVIAAGIFSRNINRERNIMMMEKQILAMQTVAASIAHEIRTPLLTIKAGLHGVLNYLKSPKKLTKESNENNNQELLKAINYTQVANNEVISTNTIIDMILINLSKNVNRHEFNLVKITDCIDEAVSRYPFQSNAQKNLICVDCKEDFYFYGVKLLVVHIIFNLLKNALASIQAAGKGRINIWVESGRKTNKLHFRDDGTGIYPDILPHIFEPFYSQSSNGAGVGLNFCKTVMESFGGSVICQSKKNHYTWFTLKFPKPEGDTNAQ